MSNSHILVGLILFVTFFSCEATLETAYVCPYVCMYVCMYDTGIEIYTRMVSTTGMKIFTQHSPGMSVAKLI